MFILSHYFSVFFVIHYSHLSKKKCLGVREGMGRHLHRHQSGPKLQALLNLAPNMIQLMSSLPKESSIINSHHHQVISNHRDNYLGGKCNAFSNVEIQWKKFLSKLVFDIHFQTHLLLAHIILWTNNNNLSYFIKKTNLICTLFVLLFLKVSFKIFMF